MIKKLIRKMLKEKCKNRIHLRFKKLFTYKYDSIYLLLLKKNKSISSINLSTDVTMSIQIIKWVRKIMCKVTKKLSKINFKSILVAD